MIFFDENLHKYKNENGQVYLSATQLIHLYTPKFDEQYWSLYKALGNILGYSDEQKKEFSLFLRSNSFNNQIKTCEYIYEFGGKFSISKDLLDEKQKLKLIEWKNKNKQSTDKGTKYHNEKELEDRKKYDNWVDYTGKDISYPNLPSNVYPELRLYNHEYKIAGTADRVIIENNIVDIEDYKTNEKLVYENRFEKMLYPLDHLDNCNVNHYFIQLNIYTFMLESLGYSVKTLALIYKEEKIFLSIDRELIKSLLNHYKENYDGKNL